MAYAAERGTQDAECGAECRARYWNLAEYGHAGFGRRRGHLAQVGRGASSGAVDDRAGGADAGGACNAHSTCGACKAK